MPFKFPPLNQIHVVTGLVAAVLLTVLVPAVAVGNPSSQVVLEVGYVKPFGDLAEPFLTTPTGLGIKQGLEMGFRWRYRFSEAWSISPSFHFVDYKDYSGENDELGDYRIQPTTLRYGLEVMYVMFDPGTPIRPLIAMNVAILRNRLQGFYKTWEEAFDSSVNALGFGARAGVQIGGFELTVVYNFNEFDTWRFFNTGYEESYNWNNLVLRAGWIIPF